MSEVCLPGCEICRNAKRDEGARGGFKATYDPFYGLPALENEPAVPVYPPTFAGVRDALAAGVPFHDVAPAGVSRAQYETERLENEMRSTFQAYSPGGELSASVETLIKAYAASAGPQAAAVYEAIECMKEPAGWQGSRNAGYSVPTQFNLAAGDPVYVGPKTGRTREVNPFDKSWVDSVSPEVAADVQRHVRLMEANPIQTITIKIDLGPSCDCGGAKANTTHSAWCSTQGKP